MKIHWLNMIAFLMTVAWVPGAEESAEIQGWTLKDGRSVQAKFVRLDGDAVKVDKDGQPFSIPLVNLSAASVTLAQKLATQASDGKPGIGAQIVAFCEGNLTKKVGDGECASLAGKALAASGAMPMKGAAPGQGDYVWG